MKKVVSIVVLFVGFLGMAQEKRSHLPKEPLLKELSVEQLATLRTKKIALALDLDQDQFDKVMQIQVENAAFYKAIAAARAENREDQKRPTAEERFQMKNERLDRQLAQEQQLKELLTKEQYALWKQMKIEKHAQGKQRAKRKKRRG